MRVLSTMIGATLLSSSLAVAASPVLIVNGEKIGRAELLVAEHGFEAQAKAAVDRPTMMKHVADQLIAQALLVQAATEAKLAVSDEEAAKSLTAKRDALGERQAEFEKAMKEQGITDADLLRIEHDTLLVKKYIQEVVVPKAQVTAAEAKAFYEANPKEFQHPEQSKLRMMVFKVPSGVDQASVAAARERADKALARVKAGQDFSAVASDVSDDTASRAYGGLVGWVQKGLLNPDLAGTVASLKAGQTSEVVRSKEAFYVLHVDEVRGAGTYAYSEVEARLPEVLQQRRVRQTLAEQLRSRRASAAIEAVDPELKAAVAAEGAPAPGSQHAGGQPVPSGK